MMVSEDRVFLTAVDSHTSSSAISAPKENGKSDMIITVKNLNEFAKVHPKNKIVHTNIEKEKKQQCLSKCNVSIELSKSTLRCRTLDSKKQLNHSTLTSSRSFKKHPRKCDNPVRVLITNTLDYTILLCKNSACKAILSSEDRFCKKCSCCICHLFDDRMDPSLWLVCKSESGNGDWCGLSCHIECALQHKKAGVVDLGQFMQLDGSYCCASCGKVSDIIGFWKKQLAIAKDAQQVDILCSRISLTYRLLNGTSKFKELHKIIEDAMGMLETEIGPVNWVSTRIVRGNVGRLSVVSDVQNLCSLAIMKAEEFLNPFSRSIVKHRDSPPVAFTFHFDFEEISSSSVVIVLNESCLQASDAIEGYKLWYCKSGEEMLGKDPVLIPKAQQRILVPNLLPCTDYAFRLILFSDDRDLGHSESRCFTRSVEITDKDKKQTGMVGCLSNTVRASKDPNAESSGFKVRNLGRIFSPNWAQEEDSDELYQEDDAVDESYVGSGAANSINAEGDLLKTSAPRQLDLNVASVPDLNDDLSLPMGSSPEENGCTLEKSGLERSTGRGDYQTCAVRVVGKVPAVESWPDCRKPLKNGFTDGCDGDSTLVSAPRLEFSVGSNNLDENYEYCVKVIRWLECLGLVEKDFRMKFLTWFSFRSTEQERWVVITFIRTFIEEPSCLAGQLLDTFFEIVNCKRPRNGFCSKLWH